MYNKVKEELEILENLMEMCRNRYPEDNYDGLVKLVIYSDGSGHIQETSKRLYDFSSVSELVEHLQNE